MLPLSTLNNILFFFSLLMAMHYGMALSVQICYLQIHVSLAVAFSCYKYLNIGSKPTKP